MIDALQQDLEGSCEVERTVAPTDLSMQGGCVPQPAEVSAVCSVLPQPHPAEAERGGPVRVQNRFTPLDVEAEAISALSRPEEFAMTECSDTEVAGPSRRLRLVWNNPIQDIPDSHDQRVARVRDAMIEERRQRQVRDAEVFITRVCERVGPVLRTEDGIPRTIRRQQWSALNVPLMWSAAEGNRGCAVLEWLISNAQQVSSFNAAGEEVSGREAALIGWNALHNTMRSQGIVSREDLAEWIHVQGFPRPRWGAHFSGRVQERILNLTVSQDVRGSAIEALYVHIVMQMCRSASQHSEQDARRMATQGASGSVAHGSGRPSGKFWTA